MFFSPAAYRRAVHNFGDPAAALAGRQNGWLFHSPVMPSSPIIWARDAGLPLHSCSPSFAPCVAHSVAGKGRPTPDHASA
jgi:hypothetical protein